MIASCSGWAEFGKAVASLLVSSAIVGAGALIVYICIWFSRIGKMWRVLDMAEYKEESRCLNSLNSFRNNYFSKEKSS